jgi:hypothetical protein
MGDPQKPPARPKLVPLGAMPSAEVIPLRQHGLPLEQPADLSEPEALRVIRLLAAQTENIVVIPYGRRKTKIRRITRRQIELCVQKGTPTEGPFLNSHGNWQMNLLRHAAGEEITCVVAIEWATRVLVINAF